jgi:pimeloyl-ACP methyl ester carboxylesterase
VARCTVPSGAHSVSRSYHSSTFQGDDLCLASFLSRRGSNETPVQRRCRTTLTASTVSPTSNVGRSIVWLRVGDLRAKDHPGLIQACDAGNIITPLFVVTPSTPRCAVVALRRLREDLRSLRSELYVRFAETEVAGVSTFLSEERVHRVYVRRDVDARALDDVQSLRSCVRAAHPALDVVVWRDELHAIPESDMLDTPSSYPEFLKKRTRKLVGPTDDIVVRSVFAAEGGDNAADVSDAGDLEAVEIQFATSRQHTFVDAIEQRFVEDSLRLGVSFGVDATEPEGTVINLLERMEEYETIDVGRALQEVIWLGLLSPRRIRELCVNFERERGRLWSPVYRLGAKTILRYLDAREFAECAAERDLADARVMMGTLRPKFYRWRGVIARYFETGESNASENKPAVCLIHGFGASAAHWKRSLALLESDYHCFAFCNVGFGRAEKPPYVYTQHLWEFFQASFVRDVVKKRTFVAGNSIGGYLAAAFACDSDWCAGAALVNSAGTLLGPEEYKQREAELNETSAGSTSAKRGLLQTMLQESRALRFAACNLLLLYLRGVIAKTLQRVYPTSPDGWTKALELEIRRDSLDDGAVYVLASGFVLPQQRTLNELLANSPPILVFQGKLDPLGTGGRAERLEKIILKGRATVEVIEAGHCPHDECPEKFAQSFSDWMERVTAGVPVEA